MASFSPTHFGRASRQFSSPRRSDTWLSAQEHRLGWFIATAELIRPSSELRPQDADLIRSLEGEPHSISLDLDYGNRDAAADLDLLAGLSAQNQHITPP
jgi:hypothetical protein